MKTGQVSRRSFIKTMGIVSGATSLGGLMPSRVLGANDRINFAVIGTGGMGTGHLKSLVNRSEADNIKVVGVCDVYRRRLNNSMEISGADGTMDYREILDRKDVDAILIATPDHWHSKITLEGLDAGKHVYVEKPMTLTVEQAIEVRNAARKSDKVVQVGPNFTADDQYWLGNKLINDGRIGKVTWAQATYNRNPRSGGAFGALGTVNETAGPQQQGEDYVDWDMWLGWKWKLAPRIPWNPDHFFRFRRYWRYNGGVATDLLYHRLAPLLIALSGGNGAYPSRVSGNGGLYIKDDGRDVPDVFTLTADYPEKYTINLVSVLTNDTQRPTRIFGQYGTMEFDGDVIMTGNGAFKDDFRKLNDGYDMIRIPTKETRDLEGNFIDVIRKGGRLHCNAELGCTTMVAIKMGVESYRQSKTLLWDHDREVVYTA